MRREALLAHMLTEINSIADRRIVRVAIDGVDGAGKTRLADELATRIGDTAIRASVDSFHHPRNIRYAKGRDSPVGFFEDSFNYEKLKEVLLDPLSSDPPQRYCLAFFDHRQDAEVSAVWEEPPEKGTLIFDGIFTHRPELVDYWDYSIFLEVSPQESVRRCLRREGVEGVSDDPTDPAHARYVEGQAIYLETCNPTSLCNTHVVNEPIDSPRLVRRDQGQQDEVAPDCGRE